jgi:hypothetical protein
VRSQVAEIIDLEERKRSMGAARLLVEWARALGFSIGPQCSLMELPDKLLWLLAKADPRGQSELEDLIVRVRRGKKKTSAVLGPRERMEILDVTLFLLDQIRFECMTRLGWIEPLETRQIPLAEILSRPVERLKELKQTPKLRQDNPSFHRFQALPLLEKETFIRKQIPQALEIFRRRIQERD